MLHDPEILGFLVMAGVIAAVAFVPKILEFVEDVWDLILGR